MTKLAREMNTKIVAILNEFEITTGYTVDDLTVARESDDRSDIVSVKPFIYLMLNNRGIGATIPDPPDEVVTVDQQLKMRCGVMSLGLPSNRHEVGYKPLCCDPINIKG